MYQRRQSLLETHFSKRQWEQCQISLPYWLLDWVWALVLSNVTTQTCRTMVVNSFRFKVKVNIRKGSGGTQILDIHSRLLGWLKTPRKEQAIHSLPLWGWAWLPEVHNSRVAHADHSSTLSLGSGLMGSQCLQGEQDRDSMVRTLQPHGGQWPAVHLSFRWYHSLLRPVLGN